MEGTKKTFRRLLFLSCEDKKNHKNRHKWNYPNLESARRPVQHSEEIPIPTYRSLPALPENTVETSSDELRSDRFDKEDSDFAGDLKSPERFTQKELSDLARDLNLPKESAELLASRLNEKNLYPGTKITYYRNREKDLLAFFSQEDNMVFCNDIKGLLEKMVLFC